MSDSKPPTLQRAWHALILLVAIALALWFITWILTKVLVWLVLAVVLSAGGYGVWLWRRHRRSRW